jgi:peptidyl-prolyl cis-trans isomerase B (cyclophilin B)
MYRRIMCLSVILIAGAFIMSNGQSAAVKPRVSIMTSKGEIVVELDSARAPNTVRNFLSYVNDGFYEGTIFHRVIKGFMIQGGGLTADMNKKATREPIKNEATNRLSNRRGTIAMARTGEPHSATAQFFINTVNNDGLDYKNQSMAGWGYCVFGKVIKGMDVVDAIESEPTSSNGMMRDVPVKPILITKTTVITPAAK